MYKSIRASSAGLRGGSTGNELGLQLSVSDMSYEN